MPALLRSHLALFTVNLLYGANYVIAKGLMPDVIGPNGFIFLRVTGATLIFWLIYSLRYEKVSKRDLGLLALCGLFGVGINQLFFFNGLMLTSPINAPVIMTTTPILVLVLSFLIRREKVRPLQLAGIIIGALGAIVFSLQNSEGGFATGLGDLFIFLNATSFAVYMVLVKPLMSRYSSITVMTWVFTFGMLIVLLWPPAIPEFSAVNWPALKTDPAFRMIFVVLCVTVLPYLLMVQAMKLVSPTVASVYIYFQPLLAAGFVYLFTRLGLEDYSADISLAKILSAMVIFAGVYMVIKPAPQKHA
jgi:drug/metabolite transporter (DMT)-like permease